MDLLVINDQDVVLHGLKAIFQSEKGINVIAEATDAQAAISKARELQPSVVVLSLRSEIDCLDVCTEINKINSEIKILVLSSSIEEDRILEFLKSGASSYVLRDTMADDLVRAIKIVASGQTLLPRDVVYRLLKQLKTGRDYYSGLTLREIEVLQGIANGLSNKEIAGSMHISETTVKTHVSHILRKLNVSNRTAAVLYAYSKQWISLDASNFYDPSFL